MTKLSVVPGADTADTLKSFFVWSEWLILTTAVSLFLLDDVACLIFEWQRHSICLWHPSSLHFPAQFIFLSLSVPLPLTQVENDQKASKGGGRVRSMLAPWWRLAWKEQLWRAWWSSIQCCIWATKGLVERVGGRASDMRERIKRQGGLFMSISSRCVLSPMQPLSHEPMGSSALP